MARTGNAGQPDLVDGHKSSLEAYFLNRERYGRSEVDGVLEATNWLQEPRLARRLVLHVIDTEGLRLFELLFDQ